MWQTLPLLECQQECFLLNRRSQSQSTVTWYCSLCNRSRSPGPGWRVSPVCVRVCVCGGAVQSAYLCTRIQQQATNGRKYNADDEEQREDRLRGQNGSITTRLAVRLQVPFGVASLLPRTAMPLIAAAGTQYLRSRQHRCPLRAAVSACRRLLGGLLLFVFFGSSRLGSWLDIESECSTCCACDMVVFPRNPAAPLVWRNG